MASRNGRKSPAGTRDPARDELERQLERHMRATTEATVSKDDTERMEAMLRARALAKEIPPPPIGTKEVQEKFKLPYIQFENKRLTFFTALMDTNTTAEKRTQAERGYVEARNDLLFMAVRHHQSQSPIQENGKRGDEYQRQMDELYAHFVIDERTLFAQKTPMKIDTVYTLALEPVLMRAFASQMLGEYGLENTREANARKTVIESTLNPETVTADLAQLETALTSAESRVLREARIEYVSSKIAAQQGVPHANARAIEKRYHELRADALAQIRKMKESTEEDNEWVDELTYTAQRADMPLEIALCAAKLSPEKQKRVGVLGAKLSKMKWGRNTLALLAIFAAVSKDAPDVDVTPLHGGAPTEDVQSPRAQAPAERTDESSASVSIAIPEGGNALSALKDVVVASNRISWITPWMEMVRQNARPDLALTREGRLEALAMNLGFMTDYTRLDRRTGAYVADSMPIPKGSMLVLDESGMRLIYNGREEQLVTVTEGPDGNILTVHPYAGMYP